MLFRSTGSWPKTGAIHANTTITAVYTKDSGIVIPTQPTSGYHGDKEELADLIARNITAYDNEKQIIQYRWTPEKDTTEDAELVIDLSRVEDIPGSYEISCYAEDAAGNRSESYTIWIELE